MDLKHFSEILIDWQKTNGRHHLPWQIPDPYARWISEIMLQQTQVNTVIEYYERFMRRFPTVESLAEATEDELMQYWSGLGYYSRARNLHRSAKIIANDWSGKFPQTREAWETLPGVGRSTAAAIVAFSFGARETILDGNVKRVLMRLFCLRTSSDDRETVKQLWSIAESLLPQKDLDIYTQGLMDFGATLCTRNPQCLLCPFKENCLALKAGLQKEIPQPKKKLKRTEKDRTFFLIWSDERCLLQKRTEKGVWKGLFSLPQAEGILTEEQALETVQSMGLSVRNIRFLDSFSHDFTHYRLILHPIAICVEPGNPSTPHTRWAGLSELPYIGLPAPIRQLLERFFA